MSVFRVWLYVKLLKKFRKSLAQSLQFVEYQSTRSSFWGHGTWIIENPLKRFLPQHLPCLFEHGLFIQNEKLFNKTHFTKNTLDIFIVFKILKIFWIYMKNMEKSLHFYVLNDPFYLEERPKFDYFLQAIHWLYIFPRWLTMIYLLNFHWLSPTILAIG